MVRSGEELVVARRVAVGPELGTLELRLPQPLLDAAGLLGTSTVGASQPPRQAAVGILLESRAHDVVDAEQFAERRHVRLERRGREDHRVPEFAVPAQAGGRVVSETL